LRLCVATLCLFLFLPLGIIVGDFVINKFCYFASLLTLTPSTNTFAGLNAGML
jgi:hypothetical protein